jgi:hypothetical protein
MTTKRQLRAKLHVSGEKAGQVLVDWLNCEGTYKADKHGSARRRIEALLNEWRSIARVPGRYWSAEEWDKLSELQRKLSRYRMTPQIDSKRMDHRGMRFTWNPGPSDEAKVILVITWLGERALLWRVKRCGPNDMSALLATLDGEKPACCGKWFYSRRKDQKFCGSRLCRQRVYESKKKTPEHRAKRTKYMRAYRASQRARDEAFFVKFDGQKANRQGEGNGGRRDGTL